MNILDFISSTKNNLQFNIFITYINIICIHIFSTKKLPILSLGLGNVLNMHALIALKKKYKIYTLKI